MKLEEIKEYNDLIKGYKDKLISIIERSHNMSFCIEAKDIPANVTIDDLIENIGYYRTPHIDKKTGELKSIKIDEIDLRIDVEACIQIIRAIRSLQDDLYLKQTQFNERLDK